MITLRDGSRKAKALTNKNVGRKKENDSNARTQSKSCKNFWKILGEAGKCECTQFFWGWKAVQRPFEWKN